MSTPGQGSCFEILLPCAVRPAAPERKIADVPSVAAVGGAATVLIVEDDAAHRGQEEKVGANQASESADIRRDAHRREVYRAPLQTSIRWGRVVALRSAGTNLILTWLLEMDSLRRALAA